MDIDKYHFKIDDADLRTIHSTFQIYRQNTKEIFKLFNDLLASLPHVHARQRRQWDIASFVAATAALSLATYNTIQIAKLETAIEVQQAKTDLLTDITKLHEQHLHQLQGQMSDIGQEIQCQHLGRTRGRPGRSHCHWRHQLFPNAVLVRLGRMQASWPNVLL